MFNRFPDSTDGRSELSQTGKTCVTGSQKFRKIDNAHNVLNFSLLPQAQRVPPRQPEHLPSHQKIDTHGSNDHACHRGCNFRFDEAIRSSMTGLTTTMTLVCVSTARAALARTLATAARGTCDCCLRGLYTTFHRFQSTADQPNTFRVASCSHKDIVMLFCPSCTLSERVLQTDQFITRLQIVVMTNFIRMLMRNVIVNVCKSDAVILWGSDLPQGAGPRNV